jgi:peptide/nickel transport system substrate-binding protein
MRKTSLRLIAGTAMAICVGAGATVAMAAEPTRGGTLNMIYRVIGAHFNPTIVSGTPTGIAATQLFSSLTRVDKDWKVHPLLAKSWTTSDDGLTITLNLVDNAVFHDGQPLTSADVKFSLETYKAQHPFKPMYAPVASIDTPDKHTVVLNLSKPHPAIMIAMSGQLGAVIPKHIYSEGNIRKNPRNSNNIVGSGPFRLKEFKPGEHLILERFDNYFRKGKPYLDKIIYKRIKELNSRIIALETGKADLAPFSSDPTEFLRYKKAPHLTMTPGGYAGIGAQTWLAFNTENEHFKDKRVRQALAYAIDKKFIQNAIYRGFATRATGPIHPGSTFYSSEVNPYEIDLKKAEALLDEAGYKRDDDGIRFKSNMHVILYVGTYKLTADYIKAQLKKIGVAVTIKALPDIRAWIKVVSNHQFDMTIDVLFNWGDPVIGVHRTYQTSNIKKGIPWSNTQKYKNAELDKLMEAAGAETDQAKRIERYVKIQQMIVDDAPIAYLNAQPYHTIYNNERVGNPPIDTIWGVNYSWDEVYIKK